MRICILIIVALACAPAAAAGIDRELAAGGASLALEDGRGTAVVRSREGSILGSVARGRVRVTDVRRGPRTSIVLSGCKTRRQIDRRTVLCVGRNISFSVLGGAWQVRLAGPGINASAKLKGNVTLQGRAGTYSIRYGADRPWPRQARTFKLG